ncbi:type II toxin-antitoxin system HicB family antitoxin [Geomonas sp.]|uniref:type II toxin-antitoxin system HicB family antitoxin n=1 Tax=Geomonas sp. TaxID=2651584 RepID=UPI002B48568F|nr:toxin-antitoxin system HicB family antitoxin [Geomonas sp.]HJV36725.1 toxin-antitoxin system HicB family antitoxin [Geomonas sp.]
MRKSDKYLKIVEWSKEDGCYVGTCPGLIYGGIHGDDEAEVYRELCEAVAEAIELYEADKRPLPTETAGREYSGRFVLRIDKELHREIALRALRAGESLNSYCQEILKKGVRQE